MNSIEAESIKVSIIIPAFNVEEWISQCLESVIQQSYECIEIIIINDGSTDETGKIVKRIATTDCRIIYVRQENQGLSTTRNNGARMSTGSLLMFLDSDDWIHPDTVSDIVELFHEGYPDVVLFRCAKFYTERGTWSSGSDEFYWNSLCESVSAYCQSANTPEILALYPLAQLKAITREFFFEHRLEFIKGLRYEDNPFHVTIFCLNPRFGLLNRRFYAWRLGRPGQITSKPHTSDCFTAVTEMLRVSGDIHSNALPFLLIALTRLICTVAQCIEDKEERRYFLAEVIPLLREKISAERLKSTLNLLRSAENIHPGDLILVNSMFEAPDLLARALGRNTWRFLVGIRLLISICRFPEGFSRFHLLSRLVRNYRMLINYSKGSGETRIDGLG